MIRTRHKLNIMIVDDDHESACELSDLLELYGFKTQISSTITQAIETAELSMPDVALVDLELDNASGIDLALYWQKRTAKIEVIFFSGRDLTYLEQDRLIDTPRMLRKPLDVIEFLGQVKHSFDL